MDCKTAQSLVIPYIREELNDEELDEFLNHISTCKECYEELEIHFTIQYALQKLDEDERVSFNMPKMLKENLRAARNRVARRKMLHAAGTCIMVLGEILLVLTLLMQIEMFSDKTIGETGIYQILTFRASETEELSGTEPDTETDAETTAGTDGETGAETATGTDAETGAKTATGTDAETGAKAATGTDAETGAKTATGTDGKTGAKTATGSDSETGAKTATGSDAETGVKTAAGSDAGTEAIEETSHERTKGSGTAAQGNTRSS